ANRACVYVNDESTVFTDWALPPTTGDVFQRSPLSWEIPVEAQFTGAIIRKLDRFVYVDYKS
ncbi:major capsid family protein, partial [Yersinia pestis]